MTEKHHSGGFWQGALSLLAQMLAGRVTPDVTSYNALISACEKGGEWQRALHLFQLCRSELQPNLVSYNAMISACQKGWQWQQADLSQNPKWIQMVNLSFDVFFMLFSWANDLKNQRCFSTLCLEDNLRP